jgi:hypothetical protein
MRLRRIVFGLIALFYLHAFSLPAKKNKVSLPQKAATKRAVPKPLGALFIYNQKLEGYYATTELRHLLTLTKTPIGDGSLGDVVKATQKQWLRPSGKERWQVQEVFPKERKRIVQSVKKLHFVDAVKPTRKSYKYAVVLGALQSRVQQRLNTLVRAYNNGVRFDSIVFLTGQRQLETAEEKSTGVKTETEMMKVLWKKMKAPAAMKKLPLEVVDAPAPLGGVVKILRPRTIDTAIAWLEQKPAPGRVLCVSNQPYVSFQDSVMKAALPATFEIETIGDGADADTSNAVYLDTVARFMYQEELRTVAKSVSVFNRKT